MKIWFLVTVENTVQQCVYLVLYHVLLIMFGWSYWRTIFADIKPIPEKVRFWYQINQVVFKLFISDSHSIWGNRFYFLFWFPTLCLLQLGSSISELNLCTTTVMDRNRSDYLVNKLIFLVWNTHHTSDSENFFFFLIFVKLLIIWSYGNHSLLCYKSWVQNRWKPVTDFAHHSVTPNKSPTTTLCESRSNGFTLNDYT